MLFNGWWLVGGGCHERVYNEGGEGCTEKGGGGVQRRGGVYQEGGTLKRGRLGRMEKRGESTGCFLNLSSSLTRFSRTTCLVENSISALWFAVS